MKTQLFGLIDGSRLIVRMLSVALPWLREELLRYTEETR